MNLRTLWNESASYLLAKGIESGRADARLLCMFILDCDFHAFIMQLEEEVEAGTIKKLKNLLHKRGQGYPLQYLTGRQEFMGLTFKVDENVLIPRPETEGLVEAVLEYVHSIKKKAPKIIDVGTGSGAIAVSLAVKLPLAELVAIDISPLALRVAAENAAQMQVAKRIEFKVGDLLQPVNTAGLFDVIVSNPPYVTSAEMSELPQAVQYEPKQALWGGVDGLTFYRRLAKAAKPLLCPQGLLALEIGYLQGVAVASLLTKQGWENVRVQQDLAGHPRIVLATKE